MPARKRKRRERTHDWQDIQQYTLWPEQQLYEKIRPVVLFQESAAERAKEIGDSPRALQYHAQSSLSKWVWQVCPTKSVLLLLGPGGVSPKTCAN